MGIISTSDSLAQSIKLKDDSIIQMTQCTVASPAGAPQLDLIFALTGIVVEPQVAMAVIVGAGCFGLSTAYHLLKRGHDHVTVLDRSPVLPAPEAASTDINKSTCPQHILYQLELSP